MFYRHEDWTLQTENSQITLFVGLFYQFHEHCLRSAYKYASIWTATAEDSVPSDEASAVVPGEYTEKIRKTFLDALYSFLDGLVHLAFADAERPNQDADQHLRSGAGSLESLHGSKKSKVIDITELDSRILITISNLSELRSVTIPKLLADMEKTCGISMTDDGKVILRFNICDSVASSFLLPTNRRYCLIPFNMVPLDTRGSCRSAGQYFV